MSGAMPAAHFPIEIEQGATFSRTLTFRNKLTNALFDFTGATGRGQVRDGYGGPLIADFTVSFPSPLTQGVLIFSLTKAQTLAIKSSKNLIYDIYIDIGSDSSRAVEGAVTISPTVTA